MNLFRQIVPVRSRISTRMAYRICPFRPSSTRTLTPRGANLSGLFYCPYRIEQLKRANCNAADCLEVVVAGTIKRPAWVRKTRARLGVSNLSQTVWSSMERGIAATMRQVKRSDNRAVNLSEEHGSHGGAMPSLARSSRP